MTIKALAIAALATVAGCSTCADAWADGLPQRAPYQSGYVGIKDRATPAFSWTGFYVSGGAGYGWGDTELTAAGPVVIDGLSSRGWTADGRAGFDFQFGNSPLVAGLLAGYKFGQQDFNASFGPTTVLATLTPTWYAGGRIGLAIQQTTLVYVGYAYTQADLDISGTGLVCAGPVTCAHDLNGHRLLIGLEKALSPNISFGIEYAHTRYDTAHVVGAPTHINLDPNTNEIMGRINIRTGNLFGN